MSPACTSLTLSFNTCNGANGNLNDTAFNQDTANTAAGINGAGPTPGVGLNSSYGPWLERIDVALARSFAIGEGKQLQLRGGSVQFAQPRQLLRAKRLGINQLQYNPIGSNCGDGASLNQTCYLVPNSGPGNFGALQVNQPERPSSRLAVFRTIHVLGCQTDGCRGRVLRPIPSLRRVEEMSREKTSPCAGAEIVLSTSSPFGSR